MHDPTDQQRREAALASNARAWDRLATAQAALARPAADEAFDDPRRWLGSGGPTGKPWLPVRLDGLELLCLAAGGGKHGPLYAAAGARVTVVDLSPAMLALDRQVAAERRLDLEIIQTSMDDLRMFAAARFDLVIHPVSTCYVPEVGSVFREVSRVTRPGGAVRGSASRGLRSFSTGSPRSSAESVGRGLSSRISANPITPGRVPSRGRLPTGPPSSLRICGSSLGGAIGSRPRWPNCW